MKKADEMSNRHNDCDDDYDEYMSECMAPNRRQVLAKLSIAIVQIKTMAKKHLEKISSEESMMNDFVVSISFERQKFPTCRQAIKYAGTYLKDTDVSATVCACVCGPIN